MSDISVFTRKLFLKRLNLEAKLEISMSINRVPVFPHSRTRGVVGKHEIFHEVFKALLAMNRTNDSFLPSLWGMTRLDTTLS